jgi:hypothetical protein
VNDRNAAFFRRFDVDRGVAECWRGNETKPRQPLNDGPREGRALPHHADDIERLQPFDHRVRLGQMVVEHSDRRPAVEHGPIRKRKGDVRVVVEDGDFEAFLRGRHRGSPG